MMSLCRPPAQSSIDHLYSQYSQHNSLCVRPEILYKAERVLHLWGSCARPQGKVHWLVLVAVVSGGVWHA